MRGLSNLADKRLFCDTYPQRGEKDNGELFPQRKRNETKRNSFFRVFCQQVPNKNQKLISHPSESDRCEFMLLIFLGTCSASSKSRRQHANTNRRNSEEMKSTFVFHKNLFFFSCCSLEGNITPKKIFALRALNPFLECFDQEQQTPRKFS